MSNETVLAGQKFFKVNDAVVFHGRNAHVVSVPGRLEFSNNIVIRYDDEKRNFFVVVPAKNLEHR